MMTYVDGDGGGDGDGTWPLVTVTEVAVVTETAVVASTASCPVHYVHCEIEAGGVGCVLWFI